jgi:farnesyl-diphosphate farnesyltransferase
LGKDLDGSGALRGERLLLEHLQECFDLLVSFDSEDRRLIGTLVTTLTRGMEMDLTAFVEGKAGAPRVLPAMSDLDRYTYFVAGIVGDFWTRICRRHLASLKGWDEEKMALLGVRFGKGLQMTNILKDLSRDLARGRCYLPLELLEKHGLEPKALLESAGRARVAPILREIASLALEHLDVGREYLLSIPRSEVRLRLAAVWPLLFALPTLRKVLESPDLLDPKVNVKISRRSVYATMFVSSLLVFSNSSLGFLYRVLRRRLVSSLEKPRMRGSGK